MNQALVAALSRVEIVKSRLHALNYAVRDNRRYREDPQHKAEYHALYRAIYEEMNDAYRDVFMWGLVTFDKDTVFAAQLTAFEHYLNEGCGISQYLDMEGMHPHRWDGDTEKKFRAEIDAAAQRLKAAKKLRDRARAAEKEALKDGRPPVTDETALEAEEDQLPEEEEPA